MEFMKWEDTFSVGIREIDTQHKRLISIINDLFNEMKNGTVDESLGIIVDKLSSYTRMHFKTEEDYFDKFGYPAGSFHKEQHTNLIREVEKFREKVEMKKPGLGLEMANFLKTWLANHIMKEDMAYSPFLKGKGLK